MGSGISYGFDPTGVAYDVQPAIDFDGNGTQETDLIPFLLACGLDDFVDYNTDNTYTKEEGPSKCDPNDPEVFESGSWTFNSDQTRIVHTPAGAVPYELEIVSVSTSKLIVEETQVLDGVTYTVTLEYN